MSTAKKPVVALAIGDPAGIGPESSIATMMDKEVYEECRPFLIGSVPIVRRAMAIKNCDFSLNVITSPAEAKFTWGTLDVLETGDYDCDSIEWGKVQQLAGKMSLDYVMKSIELGMAVDIDVVSTAPIHKEAIKLAGCKLPGHTEIYQVETDSDYGLTMFHLQKLRVFFVSRHIALKEACDYANKERVLACVQQIHHEFSALNIHNPRIAVARSEERL